MDTSGSEKKEVKKIHGLKSLPTEGYDEVCTEWLDGDQEEHMDEALKQMKDLDDRDMPLSVLYAIEKDTRLRIRPFGGVWTTVTLQPRRRNR